MQGCSLVAIPSYMGEVGCVKLRCLTICRRIYFGGELCPGCCSVKHSVNMSGYEGDLTPGSTPISRLTTLQWNITSRK